MSDPIPRRDEPVPNIFISYRRADSPGHAGWLNASLKEHFGERIRIFMDFDAIDYGEDFVEVIKRAVGSSLALIVIIGRQWVSVTDAKTGRRRLENPDDLVRLEVATALSRNIRVIPVLVEGATMPTAEELPADLAGLARRNAIEISDVRFKFDVKRLVETLERVLPPPSAPTPDGDDRRGALAGPTPAKLKKAGVALAAVALAAVALVSYGVWRFSGGGTEDLTARVEEINSNGPVGNNAGNVDRPVVNSGGPVTGNSPTPTPPAPDKPGRDAVQVVRVLSSDRGLVAHGFFTPEGYIVTLAGAVQGRDEVRVVWRHGEREMRESAQVVRRGAAPESASFLKLKEAGLIRLPTPIRLSSSLTVNEAVERFLGSHDRTPGRVLKLRSESGGGGFGGMLVTTKISSGGDAGAPVLDQQGRIVAMVVGGSANETLSIPVETLKLNFIEAF